MPDSSPFQPPQSTVAQPSDPDDHLFKSAGLFLLKCVVFTLVFWVLWMFAIRPITSSSNNSTSSNSSDAQQEQMMKKYWEQIHESDRLQAEQAKQQVESEKQLKMQAELLQRFETVIQRWEAQAPSRK